jgi:hypothetical protein
MIIKATCPVGSHPFEYEQQGGHKRTYCSQEHANKANAQRALARNSARAERYCSRCDTTKPAAEFAGATSAYCKLCMASWARDRRARGIKESPDYTRTINLARYSLTPESFDALLAAQGGLCKICGVSDPGPSGWQVDHDHSCCNTRKKSCGRCLRGILCTRCNIGIGNLRDDPDIILAALQYILAHRARSAGA